MNLKTLARGAAIALIPIAGFFALNSTTNAEGILPVTLPAPALDETATGTTATAVFAGGCFWGVQGVFQHVKGVTSAVSGYSGGTVENPSYELVTSETTGHAEAVTVDYDPSQVTYGQLLQVFFSVITDPTTLNYQGNDYGTSYRSALFTMTDEQKSVAEAYIAQLDATGIYPAKIVTEVTPFTNFYNAEDYHQDNAYTMNVNPRYIAVFDLPKIENFKAQYPDLWVEKPILVFESNRKP